MEDLRKKDEACACKEKRTPLLTAVGLLSLALIAVLKSTLCSLLVRALLPLSHGNADCERGFSENQRIMDNHASLKIVTINGMRQVKSYTKRFDSDPSRVPLTRKLLVAVKRSRKTYLEHLQREAQDRNRQKTKASEQVVEGKDQPWEEKRVALCTSNDGANWAVPTVPINHGPSATWNCSPADSASDSEQAEDEEDDPEESVTEAVDEEHECEDGGNCATPPDTDFSAEDLVTLVMDFAITYGMPWTIVEKLMTFDVAARLRGRDCQPVIDIPVNKCPCSVQFA
ncbi:hypothetical protein HPB47_016987 [Ixodes persulcatus]|uniref:Uncharacterized protein n=1 Tax=Ixodes persulcatus TaxID=34615 RepID=A0AC60QT17_IXOPE|nr:hypothetical protein HPB47_016987 [Ixodes persulcatus]